MVTRSEALFEGYCAAHHIECERIAVSSSRTPDYRVRLKGSDLVCEVKQLETGGRERDALTHAIRGGVGTYWVQNRVRQKMKNVSGQLKSASTARTPTLLVVFDNSTFSSELEHSKVVQALYGSIAYPIEVSGDSEPTAGDPFFAGDRAFTPDQNTSLSALAVLEEVAGQLRLRVYHNLHAAVPIDPELFGGLPVEQKVLPGSTSIDLEA